ncbi:MAG: hypothetical protein IT347_02860 [Candidatus Eisenbacteria bacterium]|nr:hypothetical protein [Candidatus Eisenbacteria bacterium]
MSRALLWSVVTLLALAGFALPGTAVAQDEVIPAKTLVRKFPQGLFCALPVSLSFTAPVEPVVITFTALQWVDDGSGTLTWTQQLIDNVTVSPTTQVAANTLPPPAGSNEESCYIGDPQPTPYFRFNRSGLEHDLLELFDDDPAPRGWNMTDGAYFNGSRSADRDVENLTDATGGSLGLGDGSGTPTAGSHASASITLGNLNQGVSYDLDAWWDAGFVRFPHDTDYLTISITTLAGVPVAKKSWGALKLAGH